MGPTHPRLATCCDSSEWNRNRWSQKKNKCSWGREKEEEEEEEEEEEGEEEEVAEEGEVGEEKDVLRM